VECNGALIPTGVLVDVTKHVDMDFITKPRVLGRTSEPGYYDTCFCVREHSGDGKLRKVATLSNPSTGIQMDVTTSEAGVQVYSGSKTAVCLECGAFPDSPNQPTFPSTLIRVNGPQYAQLTIHTFSIMK
jgi:aldose 1-epimerase